MAIVVCGIRKGRRKSRKRSSALDPDYAQPKARQNTYDAPNDAPKSPILTNMYHEVELEEDNNMYAEVPETVVPTVDALPDVLYHTVHRPESCTEEDEVQYGTVGSPLCTNTIMEEQEDEDNDDDDKGSGQSSTIIPTYTEVKPRKKVSDCSSTGSIDNVIYETKAKNKVSNSSSVGSVENAIYERKEARSTTPGKHTQVSYKPSCTSIGSIDNVIYECSYHEEIEQDVFSPPPSGKTLEGIVLNVICEELEKH